MQAYMMLTLFILADDREFVNRFLKENYVKFLTNTRTLLKLLQVQCRNQLQGKQ